MKSLLFASLILALFFTACGGKKTTKLTFNGGELLYTDSITAAQAQTLGDYLVKTKFYDGKEKTVQLDKENGVIHFAMVLNDSLINTPQYQTMGVAFVAELEEYVFPNQKVELDYCDETMAVKKNIKGGNTVAAKDEDTAPTLSGNWICKDITGGAEDDASPDGDLDVLRKNFTFTFNEDRTFKSDFVNQGDVSNPMKVSGYYTVVKDKISLDNLTINGAPIKEGMVFSLGLTDKQLQLVSHNPNVEDLVMTFERK